MVNLLKSNKKTFAWSVEQMPDIDPRVAFHKLYTHPDTTETKKNGSDRKIKFTKKVNILLVATFIKPVV